MSEREKELSGEEIARRRDAALLRALKTPFMPHKAEPKPAGARAEAQRRRREKERRAQDGKASS
jgi:hypothetical protein